MHNMRTMKGKKGYLVVKVDLEKAYGRFERAFIEYSLREVSLPGKAIDIVMACMTTSTMQIV